MYSESVLLDTKTNLSDAKCAFENLKNNKDLYTRGLEVIKYGQDLLEEITKLMYPDSSRSSNENINVDYKASKNEKNTNEDCEYVLKVKAINYKFRTFIVESITFQKLKSKFGDLCLYVTYCKNMHKEIACQIEEINNMIDKLKNAIKDWLEEDNQRSGWEKIRCRAMSLATFLLIPHQQFNCEIAESEISGGGLVRGSDDHIVQRSYLKYKVAEKTTTEKSSYELRKEINFMRDFCECSNILEFYGYCRRSNGFSIISEWADYNLQAYLNDHLLDPTEKLSIARGIASALDYCHEKNILHYDIRTSNILLNEFLQPKLYNFRINEDFTSSTSISILRWSSPERIRGEKYSKASEVYSFALVMWAIVYQQMPFITITSKEEIKRQILDKNRPEFTIVDGIPVEYQEIIRKSWSHNPSARHNMKTILEHLNRLDLESFSDFSDQDADDYFDFNSANIDPATATILKSKEFEMCHRYSQYPSKSKEIEQGIEYHKDKKYEYSWNIFKEYCHLKSEDPHANFWVGFYYLKGHYIKKDLQEGLKYLKKASELQHPDAQYWYSLTLLNNSVEFENDGYEAALRYLRISALTNHKALGVLGRIVQTGIYGRKANYLVGKAMIDEAHKMKTLSRKLSSI
ncbi:kinase-like protein [Gigaspora margarita]|uniref:Kinase-like protein n=1 Tax=Gigaspora margarita TaxID=4874 RepID=A0A8H4A0R7_GIGMA|nr:kinase-like protein [Gigaspora margarita]